MPVGHMVDGFPQSRYIAQQVFKQTLRQIGMLFQHLLRNQILQFVRRHVWRTDLIQFVLDCSYNVVFSIFHLEDSIDAVNESVHRLRLCDMPCCHSRQRRKRFRPRTLNPARYCLSRLHNRVLQRCLHSLLSHVLHTHRCSERRIVGCAHKSAHSGMKVNHPLRIHSFPNSGTARFPNLHVAGTHPCSRVQQNLNCEGSNATYDIRWGGTRTYIW